MNEKYKDLALEIFCLWKGDKAGLNETYDEKQ